MRTLFEILGAFVVFWGGFLTGMRMMASVAAVEMAERARRAKETFDLLMRKITHSTEGDN